MNARTQKKGVRLPDDQPAQQQPADAEPEQQERLDKTSKDVTELNNIAGSTANSVGQDREEVVRSSAIADAARRGVKPDLAPPAAIGAPVEPASLKRKAMIGGVEVSVEMPVVRRNSAVEQFGPESKHPPGTLVNKDGTAFEKTTATPEPYGVIGHIDTPQGKLVNRIIPFDAVKEAA